MTDAERNPLELSDEEMMEMPEPELVQEEVEEEQEETITNTTNEGDENDEETNSEEEASDAESDSAGEEETASEGDTQEQSSQDNEQRNEETFVEDLEDEVVESDTSNKTSSKQPDKGVDYEAEYKKVFAPFRANGRDVSIQDADQAIQLMQMGAGYNEKMAGLKPSLKILKMLENNALLSEEKINYLIDLDKKNPEAITKLIKDSGMDPLDVDLERESEYNPNSYAVDDKQVELDSVLSEIEQTDTYASTIDVIGNKWDDSSKKELYESPADIRYINDQMASGIYKQIDDVVQNQKMLGNLNGLSDIEAYRQVGTYMQQNNLFKGQAQTPKTPLAGLNANGNTNQNPELKQRKKAASGTKAAPSSGNTKKNYNPLSLSDEEFDKVTTPQI